MLGVVVGCSVGLLANAAEGDELELAAVQDVAINTRPANSVAALTAFLTSRRPFGFPQMTCAREPSAGRSGSLLDGAGETRRERDRGSMSDPDEPFTRTSPDVSSRDRP